MAVVCCINACLVGILGFFPPIGKPLGNVIKVGIFKSYQSAWRLKSLVENFLFDKHIVTSLPLVFPLADNPKDISRNKEDISNSIAKGLSGLLANRSMERILPLFRIAKTKGLFPFCDINCAARPNQPLAINPLSQAHVMGSNLSCALAINSHCAASKYRHNGLCSYRLYVADLWTNASND